MARKRYKPEEIVGLLRQAEVLHGQGMSMADAIRQLGISEVDRVPRSGVGALRSRRYPAFGPGRSDCHGGQLDGEIVARLSDGFQRDVSP